MGVEEFFRTLLLILMVTTFFTLALYSSISYLRGKRNQANSRYMLLFASVFVFRIKKMIQATASVTAIKMLKKYFSPIPKIIGRGL
jgi:hypothetical protein